MKDEPFTKQQAKTMITCFFGLFMLATPTPWAIVINRFLGCGILLFAFVIMYREFINKNSVDIKEKVVSFVIILAFIIAGGVLIINNGSGGDLICTIGGVFMVILGISDLLGSKEMLGVYCSLIFAIIGTITMFYPYRTDASIIHVCGIYICYYSLISFLKDKFG